MAATHKAVVMVAVRAPLALIDVPTVEPEGREVQIHVEWGASTPFDLHQNDGGLLAEFPQVMGDNAAGTVVKIGPDVQNLAVGDKVFGFSFGDDKRKAHQDFAVVLETALGKIPQGVTPQEAVTVPNNTVTAFHAITKDLGLPLDWPLPALSSSASAPSNPHANTPILIWGGASSVGQYALQILSHWGYKNLLTTASARHHEYLRVLGARHVFDYRDAEVAASILKAAAAQADRTPVVPFVFDCAASQKGSVAHIAKIAQSGTRVAVLLPVVVRDATDDVAPEYLLDVQAAADWVDGVEVRGVLSLSYQENEFFDKHLQSTIIPTLVAEGALRPNKQKIVEGATLLQRAQNAMDMLRRKDVSGERLVWRVSDLELGK